MTTRFIGDVHGKTYELGLILNNLPETVDSVIQVGDMGVGFGQGEYWHNSLDTLLTRNNCKWIRGNHDNLSICKTMDSWIPDGLVKNDTFFLGGAWSIDYKLRTNGYDWWDDEEVSYKELNTLIDVYKATKPRIVVTHDCPDSVSKKLFLDTNLLWSNVQYPTRTARALQAMFEIHQPELWVFGHWHIYANKVINNTKFICLSELQHLDIV